MAGEGRRTTLGDYFTLQRGTTYKSRLLGQPGPVLLGLATIQRNGGFRTDSLQTYGGESPTKLLVQPGDLYLSLKDVTQSADLLGAVARLPIDHPPGRLTQDTVKLEPKGSDVPLDYLYWLLRTPQYRSYCGAHATGTTNLGLAREDFLAFPAPEPTPDQHRIVKTLSMLDAKIELNRRMNETLEAMARVLFKSWFVDFDPVRAKAEGRDSSLPKLIADLLPSSFEDSELGEIPKGWRASTLGEEVTRCGGRIQTGPFGSQLHASDYVVDGVPVVMPKDLSQRRVSTLSIARVGLSDAQRLSRHRLEEGDIVYSRRGDVERHGLVRSRETGWLCGTGCLLVRLGPRWPSPLFASVALDRLETRAWIVQHAIGATMPNLNTGILARVPIVVPPDGVMRAFNRVAQPFADRVIANDVQSETLVSLRDSLLPKLISGVLRVKHTERLVAGATK
jgi:type I restriction enzyme S subunit